MVPGDFHGRNDMFVRFPVGEGLDPPFFASIRRGEQKVNCPKGKRGHPGVLLVRAVTYYEFAQTNANT